MLSNTRRTRPENTSQLLHRASTAFARADEQQEQFRQRLQRFEETRKQFELELADRERENVWLRVQHRPERNDRCA